MGRTENKRCIKVQKKRTDGVTTSSDSDIAVFMLRPFHPPDTENTQLNTHRTDIIALYVSSMTSKANYEVFVSNSKKYA